VREGDILRGFEAGADDYITKPFSSKVLLARIHAVLKRRQAELPPSSPVQIECGDLFIDLARRQVKIAGREIYLTPTEYSLLYELASHPNQVMLHEQLLTKVWGEEYRSDVDYLRSYIHYLRKKLETDPANPCLIVSSPGIGYMLSVPHQEANETISH
jgi:two-component system KDP operon response regulator KdpE